MSKFKVSIIGAGNVGTLATKGILDKDIADVVLVDIVDGLAKGKSIDLNQAQVVRKGDFFCDGTNDFSKIAGSEIVVVCAGQPRLPGMTREDLLKKNNIIVSSIAKHIKDYAKDSIIIAVTNPLDVMTRLLYELIGCSSKRIMGMGGVLDTSRYHYYIAREFNVPVSKISGFVIGAHGETMLPLISNTKIDGKNLTEIADKNKQNELAGKAVNGGAEIVGYLKTGSAYFAPGASIAVMVEAILKDTKQTFPACVKANGEYGLKDVFIGLPVILGKNGVEKIVEYKISDSESEALKKSAGELNNSFEKLKTLQG